jgi:hypothetical protein
VNQPDDDAVAFISGHVATRDSTPLPNDASVQRICNNRVRQQVYVSLAGDFSMHLPAEGDSFVDASGDASSPIGLSGKNALTGIPRRELTDCELRASASGFLSASVFLAGLIPDAGTINVGSIVVERTGKVKGATVDAGPYQAPDNARKAYEKGLGAEKHDKLGDARGDFEKAVALYPRYTAAWFRLGAVLEKQNEKDAARDAYTRATAINAKFLPPYFSLASLAVASQNWTEVVTLTDHILSLEPMKQVRAYVVDLDTTIFGEAYFYNALANYNLNRFEAAEKSALEVEYHADALSLFPQVHLLLAQIFYQNRNYPGAIAEMQNYLQLIPRGETADQAREQLVKLEKLEAAAGAGEKPTAQ